MVEQGIQTDNTNIENRTSEAFETDTVSYRKEDRSLYISSNRITEDFSMPHQHFHIGYEIYYLHSGERYYFIQDRTYHVTPGTLAIINTHELHRTASAGIPGYARFVINFRDKFLQVENPETNRTLQEFYRKMDENHCFVLNLNQKQQKWVEQIIGRMVEEIISKDAGFEAFLQTLLMQLVLTANRYIENLFPEQFQHISVKHKNVSGIIQYINHHFAEPLNISEVSSKFYISPFYLSRIFREATGFTFVEYLNTLRIKESQKLLINTRTKINQIYHQVGFGSISQFNRVFKQITGISPHDSQKNVLAINLESEPQKSEISPVKNSGNWLYSYRIQ